jgi:hypothetical protein
MLHELLDSSPSMAITASWHAYIAIQAPSAWNIATEKLRPEISSATRNVSVSDLFPEGSKCPIVDKNAQARRKVAAFEDKAICKTTQTQGVTYQIGTDLLLLRCERCGLG